MSETQGGGPAEFRFRYELSVDGKREAYMVLLTIDSCLLPFPPAYLESMIKTTCEVAHANTDRRAGGLDEPAG